MRRSWGWLLVLACAVVAFGSVPSGSGTSRAQEQARSHVTAGFEEAAAGALDWMVKEARTRGMKGVAVVAFAPGDATREWSSRMRVVESFVHGKANVLGIAYAKLSEMADTLEDSGRKTRPPLHGELGYKGGAIRKVPGGHLLAAFSGGKDTDDLVVANVGLDALEKALAAAHAAP
jgi:hypothetical protein